ncbi:MAG: hypothetical protein AAF667_07585 [Pseudomonadota bacterium]
MLRPSLASLFLLCVLSSAQAQTRADLATPEANAVARLAGCTAVLVTDLILVTAAHCLNTAYRQEPPEDAKDICQRMPDHHGLQDHPKNDIGGWQEIQTSERPRPSVVFGATQDRRRRFETEIFQYALPRCADIALLRLFRRVPAGVAKPLPVVTRIDPVPRTGATIFDAAELRYAGWGFTAEGQPQASRQTGRTGFWDQNGCMLYALPPQRPDGQRILKGDSGSPLIISQAGARAVVGILFGLGEPDRDICGKPKLRLPGEYGAYTPTWRPTPMGTDATDLGEWFRKLIPEAAITWPAGAMDTTKENGTAEVSQ